MRRSETKSSARGRYRGGGTGRQRIFPLNWKGEHARRTREQIIEELSLNFLEHKALERGHQLVPATKREYGYDATMFHFSPQTGEIENGEVRFQLKATDHLDTELHFLRNRRKAAPRISGR